MLFHKSRVAVFSIASALAVIFYKWDVAVNIQQNPAGCRLDYAHRGGVKVNIIG